MRGKASKKFYKKCSGNSRSQIVFRTDIFRKLTLGAPGKYCREGHLFSSRIYKQSQTHDEIDIFIYTTKSVTKEIIVDSVVFLDGCDQFEDKIHSLLHCSPLRDNI